MTSSTEQSESPRSTRLERFRTHERSEIPTPSPITPKDTCKGREIQHLIAWGWQPPRRCNRVPRSKKQSRLPTLARENSPSGTTALPAAEPASEAGTAGGEDDSAARTGATASPGRRVGRDRVTWFGRLRGEAGAGSTVSARTACAAHCTDMPPSLAFYAARHGSSEWFLRVGAANKCSSFSLQGSFWMGTNGRREMLVWWLGFWRVEGRTSGSPTNQQRPEIKSEVNTVSRAMEAWRRMSEMGTGIFF